MTVEKASVLLVGSGGVGTIAALNLETGGRASVTAVLRSNYNVVKEKGFKISSCDHGVLEGWRPTEVVNKVPSASEKKFDYIVVVTKNVPDCPPTVAQIIAPAVMPGHTVIVLVQNGLNIQKPIFEAFPDNICLSAVSVIQSHEIEHGVVENDDTDNLSIGAFHNPKLSVEKEQAVAKEFVEIYKAGGKCITTYVEDVPFSRWRKLMYNTCINSVAAVTGMNTGELQLAKGTVDGLIRPLMDEVRTAAKAAGVQLPEDITDFFINNALEPIDMYFEPSMLVDVKKGNFIEFENIVGEPLREGTALGVPMPTLKTLYHLLSAIQYKTKIARGTVTIPPKGDYLAQR
ncbi:putative 2-dehydropantoate 2-reductase family protein [Xylona heveae TC161]|uniref:2-dehydropantoate 2-reductase n=1 Tax=Xylona heveae (strain CBS 132557 / TC161) TaxID=1328760 RepID=A0A165A742_XYLHT|nr:putative 2-dehydropantoate 2-reductase family protein [Xylona heveae TC161]KZF20048.1 putative 2-dehydropantoate 2-reductase family protein [Xylona heveae TC161]